MRKLLLLLAFAIVSCTAEPTQPNNSQNNSQQSNTFCGICTSQESGPSGEFVHLRTDVQDYRTDRKFRVDNIYNYKMGKQYCLDLATEVPQ